MMATEFLMKRPHSGIPWGFRLIGGSDSHLPIIVSKVVEGSVAEQSGLEEDVLLEKINHISTSGLTHAEVNQIILAAENELLLTIRRVDLENLILASLNEEESNSEITNILREAVNRTTTFQEETELEELGLKKEFGVTMIIENKKNLSENQTPKEEHVCKNRLPQGEVSGKKWSTFLQKPKNPKPKPKNQAPPIPKSEQYRVIITKQPKREKAEIKLQTETQKKEEIEEIEEREDLPIQAEHEIPMELEISVKTHVTEETEITVEDAEEEHLSGMENIGQNESMEETIENVGEGREECIQYDSTENQEFRTDVTIENPLPEETMSLEEQLAAVQKQLQELAQLPSSIQETLAVVTKQLAHIVGDKTHIPEDVEDQTKNEESNEGIPDAVTTEADEIEEQDTIEDVNPDIQVDEASDKAEMEDLQSDILSDICEEQEISETTEQVNYEELLAAQLEEQRIEEERQAKHQLEIQEEEKRRRRSLIRPIILPGGRRWVDEDDVAVKVKNPKMTDEKICNTLESFSEVIIGNTKGINFLKYTPPAKNLEYLQRSEVYRLVHGMEPPVRGISLRSEKVLAAQDYYTAGSN